jgi:hypothetical protein
MVDARRNRELNRRAVSTVLCITSITPSTISKRDNPTVRICPSSGLIETKVVNRVEAGSGEYSLRIPLARNRNPKQILARSGRNEAVCFQLIVICEASIASVETEIRNIPPDGSALHDNLRSGFAIVKFTTSNKMQPT